MLPVLALFLPLALIALLLVLTYRQKHRLPPNAKLIRQLLEKYCAR